MNDSFATLVERWIEQHATGFPFRLVVALFVLACAVLAGSVFGLGSFFLTIAGGMLLLIIGLLWNSLQSLTDENAMSLEEALALGGPTPQEEQKRSVLRALKDLEYERSVGKISEEDYSQLTHRYRQQAKELLRALDQNLAPYRERVESELRQQLAAESRKHRPGKGKHKRAAAQPATERTTQPTDGAQAADAEASPDSTPTKPAEATESEPRPQTPRASKRPTRRCKACDTRNDLDAHYCKHCGQALGKPGQVLCATCPAVFSAELPECPECGLAPESQ